MKRAGIFFMTGLIVVVSQNFLMAQTNTFPLDGNVGIGTPTPHRKLEIGEDDVAGISFEGFTTPPNSGVIRFGDTAGWKLHIGRSREAARGVLNSGTIGLLMTIQDNGKVGIGTSEPGA